MSEVAKEYLKEKQKEIHILQFDLFVANLSYGIIKLFFDISKSEKTDKEYIKSLEGSVNS